MSKGKLFVISGASGVGKSTVLRQVMNARTDLRFSVSTTTRAPRPGEVEGESYYFVTKEAFRELIATGQMLEYDFHNETYYGTPAKQLDEKLQTGHVVLDIEPNGAFHVRAVRPDATLIFVMPPSFAELERRLRGRGDTSEGQMRLRLDRAQWEMEQSKQYDFVVVNDDVERCAQEILNIIASKADEK